MNRMNDIDTETGVCNGCESDAWECEFCCKKCFEDFGECPDPECNPMDI